MGVVYIFIYECIPHPQFFVMEENELFPCNKCKGEGKFLVPGKQIDAYTYMAVFKICEKCGGDGKLDWVSMAMGGKKKNKKEASFDDELLKMLEEDTWYEQAEMPAQQVKRLNRKK